MTQASYDSNKIAIRALSRGIGTKLFNQQVKERYGDNSDLMDTCTIQDWDTMPEIVYKQLTYFFTLGNFTPVFEEKVYMRNKPITGDKISYPWMIIHLKFKEKYITINGITKTVGQRRIKISNVDIDKADRDTITKVFKEKSFTYGNKFVTYNFNNGKEIRLEHCKTQIDGIDFIDLCLPFTQKETHQEGELKDNVLTVNKPKNTPKIDSFGMTGYVYKITIHERISKKTEQLLRVMIGNNAR